MRRRATWLTAVPVVAVLAAGGAAGASAQEPPAQDPDPGAQPAPPGPPGPPDIVISGRHVRVSRANVAGIRMGCRATRAIHAGDACIGSITLRLANALTVPFDPPGKKPPTTRRINPFAFAVRDFALGVGEGTQLRIRVSPAAGRLVRDQEQLRVDVIVRYNSRAGAEGTSRRNVRFYFPKRPGV